ncbi:MAG: hypothetical protein ACJ8F0_06585 [Xanthobacteraceae bacterium]
MPWTSNRFAWWLQPKRANDQRTAIAGTAVLLALYGLMVLVFWRLF